MQPSDPQLRQAVDYVKSQLARGVSSGEIAAKLRESRYNEQTIGQVLSAAGLSQTASQPASAFTVASASGATNQFAAPSLTQQPSVGATAASAVQAVPSQPSPVSATSPYLAPTGPTLQPISGDLALHNADANKQPEPTKTPQFPGSPPLVTMPAATAQVTQPVFAVSDTLLPPSQPVASIMPQPQAMTTMTPMTPTPPAPANYNIVQALTDALAAIQCNLVPFLMTVLAAVLASGIIAGIFSYIFIAVIVGDTVSLFTSTETLIGILIGGSTLLVVWYGVAYALATAATGLALKDGLNGHLGDVAATLKAALKPFFAVAKANTAFFLLAGFPYFIALLAPLLLAYIPRGVWSPFLGYLLPVLTGVAILWIVFISLKFALVPYVALFEDQGSLAAIFRRSQALLAGGWAFMAQLLGVIGVVAVLLVLVAGAGANGVTSEQSPLTIIVAIALKPIIDCIFILFYRNRVIIKDGTLAASSITAPQPQPPSASPAVQA